ncbi:MAG TPA: type II toxin-antitoxin system death-on-curing family toxin [Oscillatoriaceae cyanobacterium]
MSEPRFLSLDEVLEIQAYQVEQHGGKHGVLNRAILESAVAQPQSGIGDDYFHAYPFGMAAAYLFHLNKGHAFHDGNKRVATHAALVFLRLNGYRLTATEDALYDLSMAVARGEVDKPAITAFLEAHAVRA